MNLVGKYIGKKVGKKVGNSDVDRPILNPRRNWRNLKMYFDIRKM